jgi:hypothetical protein
MIFLVIHNDIANGIQAHNLTIHRIQDTNRMLVYHPKLEQATMDSHERVVQTT